MRLLFVVHQFLPQHITGTEQYVRGLALRLRARGHEVTVFALEPILPLVDEEAVVVERDEEVDGIPVRRVGMHIDVQPNNLLSDYRNPLAVRLLQRFLAQNEFDLAHVFHLRYLGIGALAALRDAGLPTVANLMDFWFVCPNFTLRTGQGELCDGPPEGGVGCIRCLEPGVADLLEDAGMVDSLVAFANAHDGPPDQTNTPVRRARALIGRKDLLLAALAGVDAVIAPSRFLRGVFEDNGFRAGVIRHVPYGVDPDRFGGARKEWGAGPGAPLQIGYVGSVTEHKGLHVLIPALRGLDDRNWRLHVHGSLKSHPDYTARVARLAGEDPRIVFHGAFPPNDLGEVLTALDLIVVPSLWYENTPFSVLEAQMIGLPVVASDLGGISETVEHGVDGFLFAAGDVEALRECLDGLLSAPGQLRGLQLGRKTRTLDANVDDFVTLYEELITRDVAAPAD